MSEVPASPARARPVGLSTAGRVLRGGARLARSWPGMVAMPVAYGATAAGLYGDHYPNLWGVVAAAAVGIAWYGSPLGRLEARRRAAR